MSSMDPRDNPILGWIVALIIGAGGGAAIVTELEDGVITGGGPQTGGLNVLDFCLKARSVTYVQNHETGGYTSVARAVTDRGPEEVIWQDTPGNVSAVHYWLDESGDQQDQPVLLEEQAAIDCMRMAK